MKFLKYLFRGDKGSKSRDLQKTASAAKERLQIIISQDRTTNGHDYLPLLKKELINVMLKYIKNIDEDKIRIVMEQDDEHSAIRVNVEIPEHEAVVVE